MSMDRVTSESVVRRRAVASERTMRGGGGGTNCNMFGAEEPQRVTEEAPFSE